MEPVISFTVHGDPKAQKRHRHRVMNIGGKHISATYDPHKKEKENFLLKCIEYRPETPFKGAVALDVDFYFPRPKSHYGTGKNADILKDNAPKFHTKKPDTDNLVKFVKDGLEGVYWVNDSIIFSETVTKHYSVTPRTEVKIYLYE